MYDVIIVGVKFEAFGGVEKVAVELCQELCKRGYRAKILVSTSIKEKWKIDSINRFFLYSSEGNDNAPFYIKEINKLRKGPRKLLVIGFWNIPNILISLCSIIWNINVITVEHSDYFYCSLKWRCLRWFAYRFSDSIVALNSFDAKKYRKINENTLIIPNPAPTFNNLKKQVTENVILFVGHLRYLKRVDILIDGVCLIKDKLEKERWKILIIGEGELKESLVNKVELLGLSNLIKFVGFQSEVSVYYSQASILVLPSDTECLPMTIIESKAYGIIPIVARYSEAVKDLVQDDVTGYTFDKGSVEGFAYMLEKTISLDSSSLADIKNNIKLDSKRFNREAIFERWLTVIKGIMEKND